MSDSRVSYAFTVQLPGVNPYKRALVLGSDEVVRIGRARSCELWVDHASVGRVEAFLSMKKGTCLAFSFSGAPVSINGVLRRGGEVREGDVLKIGEVTILVKELPRAEVAVPQEAEDVIPSLRSLFWDAIRYDTRKLVARAVRALLKIEAEDREWDLK